MNFLRRIFQPKHLRLDVTEGLDRDNFLWLTGDRLVVGSAENAHLRLTAAGTSLNHVVLRPDTTDAGWADRLSGEERWRYMLEGQSFDTLNGAKARRTGEIGLDDVLRVGGATELRVVKAEVTESAPEDIIKKVKTLPFPIQDYWAYASVFYIAVSVCLALAFVGWNARAAQDNDGERSLQIVKWLEDVQPTEGDVTQTTQLSQDFVGCDVTGVDPVTLEQSAVEMVTRMQLLRSSGRTDRAVEELRDFEASMGDAVCQARTALRCDIAQMMGNEVSINCDGGS